jgi:pimeloyl-ACP methyl ester carboxylesterase
VTPAAYFQLGTLCHTGRVTPGSDPTAAVGNASERATADSIAEKVALEVDGIPLSGLLAWPGGRPRALIVALHGGGLSARYYDGPAHPDASLLKAARELGFAALAIDRPGYGASADRIPEGLHLEEQAELIWSAIEGLEARLGEMPPLFLLGHSFGMKVALQMASISPPVPLVGVECSGAGVRYNEDLPSHPAKAPAGAVELSAADRLGLFWGPSYLYPPGTMDRANRPTSRVPVAESIDSATWPHRLPEIAAKVSVPVHYTVADHERWWDVRPATLDEFKAMFSASPRVEVCRQVFAGHNISLGWTARAYHLRTMAFASECLVVATTDH